MTYRFENTAGRHLGTVNADSEDEARSVFYGRYCEEHNVDPRNPEHNAARRGLIDLDRVVCTPVAN